MKECEHTHVAVVEKYMIIGALHLFETSNKMKQA